MLTHGIGQADFILMDFVGEAIFVEDCELVHRLFPISAGTPPIGGDVSQGQPNQL